jgi:hypothetical protein
METFNLSRLGPHYTHNAGRSCMPTEFKEFPNWSFAAGEYAPIVG